MRDTLIADNTDIKFECPQCEQRMVVEKSAAGLKADCPKCGHPITVPHVSAPETIKGEAQTVHGQFRHESVSDDAPQVVDQLEAARTEIARQNALFKKAVDECERLKANATHVQAENKSFQADRQQLKADLAQARMAAATAEAQAVQVADSLTAIQRELTVLRSEAEAEITELHRRLSTAKTQLAASEKEMREGKSEHTEALRSLAKTRAEFSKVNTEAARLRSEIEVLQKEFQAVTQGLAVSQEQLQEVRARFKVVDEEHQQASTERDDWRQQAEGLQHDLAALDAGRDLLEVRARHKELQQQHQRLEIALAERDEAAKKNDEVLRGIVNRQNTTLGVYHSELRHLRRARFTLRLVYGLFTLGLLALGYVACYVFAPQQFSRIVGPYLKMFGQ
jgi:chromosome segregation ATPase